jgi:hypothetical protein
MSESRDADFARELYGATTPVRRDEARGGATRAAEQPPTEVGVSSRAAPTQPLPESSKVDPSQPTDAEPEGVKEDDDSSLYNAEVLYRSAIDPDLNELAVQANLPEEHVTELRRGAAQIFNELEIPVAHAATLHALHVHYLREPASDETEKGWRKETYSALQARYGAETEQRLAAAKEYVKARPGLAQVLHHSGLGSHPRVVEEIVASVVMEGAHGAERESMSENVGLVWRGLALDGQRWGLCRRASTRSRSQTTTPRSRTFRRTMRLRAVMKRHVGRSSSGVR